MLQLRIEAFGETIVARNLMRFAANAEAPKHALEAAADVMRESTVEQFATEGGHASGGWKALTPARVAVKEEKGLDPHILRATNRLMHSLTRKWDPQHIERLSGDSLVFGSTVSYGVYHQSSRPRTIMPYRPPVALNQADRRKIVKVVQAALLQGEVARGQKSVWGRIVSAIASPFH